METSEDIDREIQALYTVTESLKGTLKTPKMEQKLRDCHGNVRKLEEAWEFEKEEQQHLFEETRKKFEAEIFALVEEIKNIEEENKEN